jgi:regulator of telomere elongation helicase 1
LDLIKTVVAAIDSSENALVESPTGIKCETYVLGTGKTLSLLCGALSWLRKYPKEGEASMNRPTIYFASRTHSQLTQVIKELKRSSYSDARVSVLGSREQMCVNDAVKVNKGPRLSTMCRQAVKAKNCSAHAKVHAVKTELEIDARTKPRPVMDIEDLIKFGAEKGCCPYYLSQEAFPPTRSDIVFLPYNYITDPVSRH